jgi:hypothetical protein
METSLHRQLKNVYADHGARVEVPVDGFRIDVVSGGELVEIQHGSLAAIRDKIRRLLDQHRVLVVKPLIIRKWIVRQDIKAGRVVGRRLSPKQGSPLDLFHELVYFTRVFPHENLTLETPLVDIEEWRFPGHGRRRRRRTADHQIEDQKLLAIHSVHRFRTPADLAKLVPADLPTPFDTQQLAHSLNIDRWVAQRVAYCLRETGTTVQTGKHGNTRLYGFKSRAA